MSANRPKREKAQVSYAIEDPVELKSKKKRKPVASGYDSSDLSSVGQSSSEDELHDNDTRDHTIITTDITAQDSSLLWETFYIFAFIVKHMPAIDCTPMDLEAALNSTEKSSLLLDIITLALTNINYTYRGKRANREYCMLLLEKYIDYRVKKNDFALSENPLLDETDFFSFTPGMKVLVMKELCDWQLCESNDIHAKYELHSRKQNFREIFGFDAQSNRIYHVGDNPRFYIEDPETRHLKILCSTIEELEAYKGTLTSKDPIKSKITSLIPKLRQIAANREAARLEQEALAERALRKKIQLEQILLEGPRRSGRSRASRKTYSDMDDSSSVSGTGYEAEDPGSQEGLNFRIGVRASSRLNRHASDFEITDFGEEPISDVNGNADNDANKEEAANVQDDQSSEASHAAQKFHLKRSISPKAQQHSPMPLPINGILTSAVSTLESNGVSSIKNGTQSVEQSGSNESKEHNG